MVHQNHASVYLFTMEGCGHCEALKEGAQPKIKTIQEICSGSCQEYKHFHLKNGVLTPKPETRQEQIAAAKVSGYPALVTVLADNYVVHSGGNEISSFIAAFIPSPPPIPQKRRGTPFVDGTSTFSSSSSSSFSTKKRRRGSLAA